MKRRPSLFNGWWLEMDGSRRRKVRRAEYGMLYRLWSKHADIRTGKAL